jgi:ABC-type Zn uptake system ZnuABC Zn-binding protein ZnuA
VIAYRADGSAPTRLGTGRLAAVRALARAAVAGLVAVTLIAACGGAGKADDRLHVVATTTVFADMVSRVGGSHVQVESLVPKGGEVHTFDPKPSDVRRVVEADLVLRNGLGLDDWLAALARDAGTNAPIVALGENLPGVTYLGGNPAGGGAVNPHLWLDIGYARKYVDRIADALGTADPAHAADYRSGAEAYGAELDALDAETRARLAAIPEADRAVISFHDAFPYFAAAYGLTIRGNIVEAPGQDPSAAQVERLVGTIKSEGVRAIFTEAQFNPALARAIAAETDAAVVSDLYTDTLGEAPLDTYVAVMRSNVDKVVRALTRY